MVPEAPPPLALLLFFFAPPPLLLLALLFFFETLAKVTGAEAELLASLGEAFFLFKLGFGLERTDELEELMGLALTW